MRRYDFRRPEKLSNDQVRLLRRHSDIFARKVANHLANPARFSVDVSLTEVDQISYSEVFAGSGAMTLICTFTLGDSGQGVLKFGLPQVSGLVDRLMGGAGADIAMSRSLTEFERSLMCDICQRMVVSYSEIIGLGGTARTGVLETDERLIPRSLPGDEIMVRSTYVLRFGSTSGPMHFCVPLETVQKRLDGLHGPSAAAAASTRERRLPPLLQRLPLPVSVELGGLMTRAGTIAGLRPGDVLALEQLESQPLKVRIGGVVRFLGRPGLLGRHLGGTLALALGEQDAARLVDLLSGGDGRNPATEFTDLHLGVLRETLVQVSSGLPTILASRLGRPVDAVPQPPVPGQAPDLGPATLWLEFSLFTEEGLALRLVVAIPLGMADSLAGLPTAGSSSQEERPAQRAASPPPPPEPFHQEVRFEPLQAASQDSREPRLDLIMDVPLRVTVVLGKTMVLIQDLISMGEGSILELDRLAGEPVELFVHDRLVAYAEVIVIDERFGVKILEMVQDSPRHGTRTGRVAAGY